MSQGIKYGAIVFGSFLIVASCSFGVEPRAKPSKAAKALGDKTNLEFNQTPLAAALLYLSDVHGVPIRAEWDRLQEVGFDGKTRLTGELKGFTLRETLERLLDERLRIEAAEDAIVISTKSPKEIEALGTPEAKEAKITKALSQETHLRFKSMPLNQALKALGHHHNVIITYDVTELEKNGWSEKTPVTLDDKGATLQAALDRILDGKLVYRIQDGILLVTGPKSR